MMKTTIEISDEHRAKLIELAARMGQIELSSLVQEALDAYIREQDRLVAAQLEAGELMGVWSDHDAEDALTRIREARARWR